MVKVVVATDKYLVSPLAPGVDLRAGEVIDLVDDVAAQWIAKGWAVPADKGGVSDGRLSE